jgi:hypothetical protein
MHRDLHVHTVLNINKHTSTDKRHICTYVHFWSAQKRRASIISNSNPMSDNVYCTLHLDFDWMWSYIHPAYEQLMNRACV